MIIMRRKDGDLSKLSIFNVIKHFDGRQDASAIGLSTLTADTMLATTGNSTLSAITILATTGNNTLSAVTMLITIRNSTLSAVMMLATIEA